MCTFVQFTHPGREHSVTKSEQLNKCKEWNYGDHRRKFLLTKGQYINEYGKLVTSEQLSFWGEWEPDSYLLSGPIPSKNGDYPKFIHEPILKINQSGAPIAKNSIVKCGKTYYRKNTDPFVFGYTPSNISEKQILQHGCFFYCNCKQRLAHLNSLDKGSIILFGSTINNAYFAIDTVFVVGDYKDYWTNPYNNTLSGFVPDIYVNTFLGDDLFKSTPGGQCRCYKGASPENPVNGMYSFVPCKSDGTTFERAKLQVNDLEALCGCISSSSLITNNLNTMPKTTKNVPIGDMKKIWDALRIIIRNQGLLEGVHFTYKTVTNQNIGNI